MKLYLCMASFVVFVGACCLSAGYIVGKQRGSSIGALQAHDLSPDMRMALKSMSKDELHSLMSEMRNIARGAVNLGNQQAFTDALMACQVIGLYDKGDGRELRSFLRGKVSYFVDAFERGNFEAFMYNEAARKLYDSIKSDPELYEPET